MIHKAGGIIVRTNPAGEREIYLIHRPRYNDWSLPKGHIEAGETNETAALREIEEETGFRCHMLRMLPPYTYVLPSGEGAEVAMIEVEVVAADATKDDESDEGVWKTIPQAIELISYPSLADYIQHVYSIIS
ncbi:MAG: NUDIX domain-containing protein [Candidatus Kerfeldbacteria bacterium]|nr:NUDIX domain-containing protein [Candidatus Kerfeldbacteria bacterium]